MIVRILIFILAGALCVAVSGSMAGRPGLEGSAVGVGIGVVLCAVNHGILLWARRVRGQAVVAAMLGSVVVSFAAIVASFFAISSWRKELLQPAILSTLVVYLAFRFYDVVESAGSSMNPKDKTSDSPGPEGPDSPDRRGGDAP